MTKEYSKEQMWKLYENLPQELKEAIFSEQTAENIGGICDRNEIDGDKISEIARYTGRVLLGILPPDEFQETLEKELKLERGLAKKVGQEIYRIVFYPVKASLEELYKTEMEIPAKPKPLTKTKKDTYRELIEQ